MSATNGACCPLVIRA